MEFGKALKLVRRARGVSQGELAGERISRVSVSHIENDGQEPAFSTGIYMMQQLGIRVDEFVAVEKDYQRTAVEDLIWRFEHIPGTSTMPALKQLQADLTAFIDRNPLHIVQDMSRAVDATMYFVAGNRERARQIATPVWDRLQKFDMLFEIDLHLLNAILFVFDTETAADIAKLIAQKVKQAYPQLAKLAIAAQANVASLHIEEGNLTAARELIVQTAAAAKDIHRYDLYISEKTRLAALDNQPAIFERLVSLAETLELPVDLITSMKTDFNDISTKKAQLN
jgi:transcriptional regulator with XRE-family HTH domain